MSQALLLATSHACFAKDAKKSVFNRPVCDLFRGLSWLLRKSLTAEMCYNCMRETENDMLPNTGCLSVVLGQDVRYFGSNLQFAVQINVSLGRE